MQDKVAIVTGGDSGIGRSVAVLFAREEADVVTVYLAEHEDARVTQAAVEKEGRRCLLISGDVRDRSFCRAAVAQTLREFGRLDVLVNNAAFQTHTARFEDLTEEHLDYTVKTNLYGYFYMAQACVEHMQSGAAILNTGSVTGLLGNKDLIDYSMTKGGIHAFTRSLVFCLIHLRPALARTFLARRCLTRIVRGPHERLRILVSMLNPFVNCGLELRDVVENASPYTLSGDFGEEPLDEVDPGAGRRREVQDEAFVSCQPALHSRCLVGRRDSGAQYPITLRKGHPTRG